MRKEENSQLYTRELGANATWLEKRRLTGIIYRIVNLINGKSYIGQTIHWFNYRYHGGKWWKYTTNILLKRAVEKYGKENFQVEIYEHGISDICLLNKLETMYIVLFNTLANNNGYNLDTGGANRIVSESSREKMSNTYILIDKSGKEYIVNNLKIFCEKRKLSHEGLYNTVRGRNTGTQGFGLKGSDPKLIYNREINIIHEIQNIEGQVIKGTAEELAKIIKVSRKHLYSLFSHRVSSCNKWFLPGSDINKIIFGTKKNCIYELTNKNNDIISGTNNQLAKIILTHPNNIQRLTNKSRKSHKGWYLYTKNTPR